MKRLLVIASGVMILVPALSLAQPPGPPDNQGQNRKRPGGAVTLPGDVTNRPGRPSRPGVNVRPPSPPPRPGSSMRPPRPGGSHFTWRGRDFDRFRAPAFMWPPGYSYRRWSRGAFLPSLLFTAQYWFNDWRMLGIDPPPPGRRWVRYGPDLLLVNNRTRRIEDVIYDVFW